MSHPEMSRADEAPAATTPSVAGSQELERPVPSSDERADRSNRGADVLQHARQLAHVGEMTAALTTLRALIAREPKHVRARQLLAELLAHKGDVESAIVEVTRALELAPDDVPNLCLRAALCTSRAKYDLAETDLKRAAKLAGFNPDVQVQLGVLFCKRARWREAIDPLRAAIAADPHNAAALRAYEAAATLEPTNDRALKRIGVVLDRMGRPKEAEAAYQRARAAQRK